MRILIAEDDFITRIYMSRFLSKYGVSAILQLMVKKL